MEVKDHYEHHLSNYYSWMFGDYEDKIKENHLFFEQHCIIPKSSKKAIDLGAGSGFQSIPLAQKGFMVNAVDFSQRMLDELRIKCEGLAITLIHTDLSDIEIEKESVELVVCMGDTLTHLPDLQSVKKLIQKSAESLARQGKLIISFRDLTFELKNDNRFIPVKSDESRIFTCFLEYFTDHVRVHDLVYEKEENHWKQKISSYKKLKLSQREVENTITQSQMTIVYSEVVKGITIIVAEKI